MAIVLSSALVLLSTNRVNPEMSQKAIAPAKTSKCGGCSSRATTFAGAVDAETGNGDRSFRAPARRSLPLIGIGSLACLVVRRSQFLLRPLDRPPGAPAHRLPPCTSSRRRKARSGSSAHGDKPAPTPAADGTTPLPKPFLPENTLAATHRSSGAQHSTGVDSTRGTAHEHDNVILSSSSPSGLFARPTSTGWGSRPALPCSTSPRRRGRPPASLGAASLPGCAGEGAARGCARAACHTAELVCADSPPSPSARKRDRVLFISGVPQARCGGSPPRSAPATRGRSAARDLASTSSSNDGASGCSRCTRSPDPVDATVPMMYEAPDAAGVPKVPRRRAGRQLLRASFVSDFASAAYFTAPAGINRRIYPSTSAGTLCSTPQ